MVTQRRFLWTTASVAAFGIALAAPPAAAQMVEPATPPGAAPAASEATPAAAQGSSAEAATAAGDDIIVIGTAGGGTRRQDAAFAVTTIDAATIERLAPASTADLFRAVPGISAESSGGQNGANIFVRGYPSGGDAEFVTLQVEGVPFFPPATLSFLENTQLFRLDETLQRVEAVRGGTGALFSSGQPGLTVNFVQRQGGQDFAGLAKLSVTDFGEVRGDGYVSGPLGPDTTFLVGGYYAASNGVRDAQFTAERGGQVSGNVRHRFERGSVLVFARYLDDHGQWLLPIPVIQDGSKIRAYPGFDAGTGTFAGNDTRFAVLNDGTRADLADGRGAKIVNLGTNLEYEVLDGLSLRDRASYLSGDADTTGLVPAGGAPQTAASFAAGLGGTVASLTATNGGASVSPNQQVIQVGFWVVRKQISSFVNDFAVEFKSGANKLTGGIYYATYSSDDQWNLGNGQLLTAEPNARRLDLTIINAVNGRTQRATRNGFAQGSFFNVNAGYNGRDVALYAVDELQITPELRIDGGLRWQRHIVDGTLENNTFGVDADGNADTLYDNGSAVLNGTFSTIRYRGSKLSWTAGANYEFSDQLGAFVRYSRGHSFPFFDNLRDNPNSPIVEVDTYEGGVKLTSQVLSAYATVFHNDFSGLTTTVITNGAPIASIGGAKTTGVELEGVVRPVPSLSISFAGTYLDAKYQDFFTDGGTVNLTGNQVQRQPKWQWRVTPAYDLTFGTSKASVFTTVAYTGNRFSDVQNQQTLPNYYKWDAGISFDLDNRIRFQATVDNITNTIGLTEGNPRVIGSQGAGVIIARPILGRSARFSAALKF